MSVVVAGEEVPGPVVVLEPRACIELALTG
jgi:hypothetical protein